MFWKVLLIGSVCSLALTIWLHPKIEAFAWRHSSREAITNPPSVERDLTLKLQAADAEIARLNLEAHDRDVVIGYLRGLCLR